MAQLAFIKSYDEVDNIRTFVFGTNGETWLPGQYQKYVLPELGEDKYINRRYFTIASAPSEGEIHISTRVTNSDFKQRLNSMNPGDVIEASGLDGDFLWEDNGPVVLIAAGIGVTPYRSMLIERHKTGKSINARLLYFGRDNNFAFRQEFSDIVAAHPEFRVDYIVGEHVTAERIIELAEEVETESTYLSGPEPMVEAVGEELKNKGVNLKQDWFPGYDDSTF